MSRVVFWNRMALVVPGIMLVLASLPLCSGSVFGSLLFSGGLALHLVGLTLGVVAWRVGQPRRKRLLASETLPGRETTPRPAGFRISTQLIRLVMALFTFSLLLLGSGEALNRAVQLVVLRQHGHILEAQITGKESRQRGAVSGIVTYAYRVGNAEFADNFRAPYALYREMTTGNWLKVTYLPTAPQVHFLGILDGPMLAQQLVALGLLAVVGLIYTGTPLLLLEKGLRRQLRLARYGSAATGVIVGCRSVTLRGRLLGYRVGYEFATPPGQRLQGNAFVRPQSGEPTLVGFPITLLYDPANPLHHRPLNTLQFVWLGTTKRRSLAL